MKYRLIITLAMVSGLSLGCVSIKPNASFNGKPVFVRTALLKECPSISNQGGAGAQSVDPSSLVGDLAKGLATAGFDAITGLIHKAAEADKASFSVNGSTAENAYRVISDQIHFNRCLIIAAGNLKPTMSSHPADHHVEVSSHTHEESTTPTPATNSQPATSTASPPPPSGTPNLPGAPANGTGTTRETQSENVVSLNYPDTACDDDKQPWLSKGNTKTCPDELRERLRSWQMDEPVFYLELYLNTPAGSPEHLARASVMRAYYPKPLSNLTDNQIKQTTLVVTATKPSATVELGDTLSSLAVLDTWLRPGTNYEYQSIKVAPRATSSAPDFGRWVVLSAESKADIDGKTTGPVDLTTTFTEVKEPTKWLQKLDALVTKNKDAWRGKLEDKVALLTSEEKQQELAHQEAISQLEQAQVRETTCASYLDSMSELRLRWQEYKAIDISGGTDESLIKQEVARLAFSQQCNQTKIVYNKAEFQGKQQGISETTVCNLGALGLSYEECDKP